MVSGHHPLRYYRYADNVVYLCRSVSAGSQALAHLRQLLEKHQLTLKKGDIQELDRGQKAELLGSFLWLVMRRQAAN
jgi:hypothetical protein